MASAQSVRLLAGACALLVVLAGCQDEPASPAALPEPCELITDDLLARLAPGSQREPYSNLAQASGTRECAVDLTSGTGGLRGDLAIRVEVTGSDAFDEVWRSRRCEQIGADPATGGPGDVSCLTVSPWDGAQTRIDGWAWVGDDYQVQVAYQLVEPQALPSTAERDLRDLLAAAVAALPVG
jgi:hypothetical protein